MPANFSVMHDLVIPYLPGADKPIIDASIRKAVREFMKRTTVIREEFAFTSTPGVTQYHLNATGGQVSAVMHVYKAGSRNPLGVATEAHRQRRMGAGPTMWWSPLPTVLSFIGLPDEPAEFTVEAALTLPQDATTMPDGLYETYGEVIASGTLSIMYAMPGKPWTSVDAAKVAGRGFAQEIKTIRGRLRDGGQPNQSTFSPIAKFGK